MTGHLSNAPLQKAWAPVCQPTSLTSAQPSCDVCVRLNESHIGLWIRLIWPDLRSGSSSRPLKIIRLKQECICRSHTPSFSKARDKKQECVRFKECKQHSECNHENSGLLFLNVIWSLGIKWTLKQNTQIAFIATKQCFECVGNERLTKLGKVEWLERVRFGYFWQSFIYAASGLKDIDKYFCVWFFFCNWNLVIRIMKVSGYRYFKSKKKM